MIAVKVQGRLGNQLFQYAFAYAASKKLNTSFYIDKSINRFILPQYFNIKADPLRLLDSNLFAIKTSKHIFDIHLKNLFYKGVQKLLGLTKIVQPEGEDTQTQLQHVSDKSIYEGYFQSVSYFAGYEQEIKKMFAVKMEHQKEFNSKYASLYLENKVVCVHIRRTDYLNLAHYQLGADDLSLPLSYYLKAISSLPKQNVHYVFIGDDHHFIEENFSHISPKTIANDSEIIDFQHLLNADHCIISNSTFSWWGAWLNTKSDKNVYAPKYFMGWRVKQEFPQNILPTNWEQIEC